MWRLIYRYTEHNIYMYNIDKRQARSIYEPSKKLNCNRVTLQLYMELWNSSLKHFPALSGFLGWWPGTNKIQASTSPTFFLLSRMSECKGNCVTIYWPSDVSVLVSFPQMHQQHGLESHQTMPCNEELLDQSPAHVLCQVLTLTSKEHHLLSSANNNIITEIVAVQVLSIASVQEVTHWFMCQFQSNPVNYTSFTKFHCEL